eukprot:m.418031 g.418031  ORF g.418031 m.418031 type:complete len:65 (+) comp56622_c0_seq4:205-399(+)
MDLQTAKERVDLFMYADMDQFMDDIRLIFKNCAHYNKRDSEPAKAGRALAAFFEVSPPLWSGCL